VFVWAKVNERVYGGYPLRQATIRVSKDPELGTVDITVNDPAFEADPKRHGGGVTLRSGAVVVQRGAVQDEVRHEPVVRARSPGRHYPCVPPTRAAPTKRGR